LNAPLLLGEDGVLQVIDNTDNGRLTPVKQAFQQKAIAAL
jgi:hypothetical protein